MRRGGNAWATVGLVVLAVVAAVLSWAAIDSTQGSAAQVASTSAVDTSTQGVKPPVDEHDGAEPDQQVGDPDRDPTANPSDADNDGAADPRSLAAFEPPLVMAGRTYAYRASTGSCSGGATLDRSSSTGARWHGMHGPAPAVLALSGQGRTLRLVGTDESCDVQEWTTHDEGRTWSAPASPHDVFVRIPDNPAALLTPTGVGPNPCPQTGEGPVSVSGASASSAAVLCATGDVVVTFDGGHQWVTRSPVVGGVAMTFNSANVGWALRTGSGQCPAYQVMRTEDRALTWQTAGCVAGESHEASVGRASLSFNDRNHGMAVVGAATYLTSDSGQSWKRAR